MPRSPHYYYIYAIIGAFVIAGVSFFAGTKYGITSPVVSKPSVVMASYSSSAVGTLVSYTPTSLTLKLPDGSTKSFTLSPNTQILATVAAGQKAPTLGTLPLNIVVSLVLSDSAGDSSVISITLAPSWETNSQTASSSGS